MIYNNLIALDSSAFYDLIMTGCLRYRLPL